jgi:hypothetical protein
MAHREHAAASYKKWLEQRSPGTFCSYAPIQQTDGRTIGSRSSRRLTS